MQYRQKRRHLEKLYVTGQAGGGSNARQQSRLCGTTTEQTAINTVTITPGCGEHSTGGGGKAIMKSGTANRTSGPGVTEEVANPGKLSKNRRNSRMSQTDALILG